VVEGVHVLSARGGGRGGARQEKAARLDRIEETRALHGA
jgi:hypothetical protein